MAQPGTIEAREDGLFLYVERPDFDDQSIAQFEAGLIRCVQQTGGKPMLLMVDLSQARYGPSIVQARWIAELIQAAGVNHFAIFGVGALVRVAVKFIIKLSGIRGSIWPNQAAAVDHLLGWPRVGRPATKGLPSPGSAPRP
jgi:hypothetical protein